MGSRALLRALLRITRACCAHLSDGHEAPPLDGEPAVDDAEQAARDTLLGDEALRDHLLGEARDKRTVHGLAVSTIVPLAAQIPNAVQPVLVGLQRDRALHERRHHCNEMALALHLLQLPRVVEEGTQRHLERLWQPSVPHKVVERIHIGLKVDRGRIHRGGDRACL